MALPNEAVALLAMLHIWEVVAGLQHHKRACHYDQKRCPSKRDCHNYFCLECETGGLCPLEFQEHDAQHSRHPWLKVRNYARVPSVHQKDLERFLGDEGLNALQAYVLSVQNNQTYCYLRKPKPGRASTSEVRLNKRCSACEASIRMSESSEQEVLVCSLECLVELARKRPDLGLLDMKEGAMESMEPPRCTKRIHRRRNTRPTTSAAANPLPQAIAADVPLPQEVAADVPLPQEVAGDVPEMFPLAGEEFGNLEIISAELIAELGTFSFPPGIEALDDADWWEDVY